MSYRTVKVFDYREMPSYVQEAFMDTCPMDGFGAELDGSEDDVYVDYVVGDGGEGDGTHPFDMWLLAEGAEMEENVLIAIW